MPPDSIQQPPIRPASPNTSAVNWQTDFHSAFISIHPYAATSAAEAQSVKRASVDCGENRQNITSNSCLTVAKSSAARLRSVIRLKRDLRLRASSGQRAMQY